MPKLNPHTTRGRKVIVIAKSLVGNISIDVTGSYEGLKKKLLTVNHNKTAKEIYGFGKLLKAGNRLTIEVTHDLFKRDQPKEIWLISQHKI